MCCLGNYIGGKVWYLIQVSHKLKRNESIGSTRGVFLYFYNVFLHYAGMSLGIISPGFYCCGKERLGGGESCTTISTA
jgi:hypothetical protein